MGEQEFFQTRFSEVQRPFSELKFFYPSREEISTLMNVKTGTFCPVDG